MEGRSLSRYEGFPYRRMRAEASSRRTLQAGLLNIVDVGVYFVILNVAALLVPQVITESVPMSVMTAVLLKVTLEIVIVVKNCVKHHFRTAETRMGKAIAAVGLWIVLAGSKFVVLKLEEILLGDAVTLGGFFTVTGLIITLMLSRSGVRALVERSSWVPAAASGQPGDAKS